MGIYFRGNHRKYLHLHPDNRVWDVNAMKELFLHTFFDGAARVVGQPDVCRWLATLAGVPAVGGMPLPARLLCDTCTDGIEIWTTDDGAPSAGGVTVYRRVLLRPVREEEDGGRWRIGVELPADVGVCTSRSLSELGMAGVVPQRVVMDGRVFPFEKLTMEQMRRMDEGRAVLTPQLAGELGLKCPAGGRLSYAELHREAERRLAACFPGGGEAEGCPLRVDLRLPDVPAERLFTVPEGRCLLRFGQQGGGRRPRQGLERHGAFRASPHRLLTVVMLYPEGRVEDARRLLRLLFPMGGLVGTMPSGKAEEWVAYRAEDAVVDYLTSTLYAMQAASGGSAGCRLYCYIPPGAGMPAVPQGVELLVRLRRLVRSFGSFFLGPVPLHGIDAEAFGWRLPSVAASLLVQMGGVPWMPAGAAGRDTTLFAGLSCSGSRRGQEEFCAGGFWHPSSLRCVEEVCFPLRRFAFRFGGRFRMACEHFAGEHEGYLPDRVVVYCHHDLPSGVLREVAGEFCRYQPVLPLVVARVRLTAGIAPCCYDPGAEGCMPPAGTCLHSGEGRMLLFCREALPALGKRRAFYPAPMEVRFDRLAADGSLLPLPKAEAEELAVETYRLVWSHPAHVDGSALPSVLSCTDSLARRHYQEWLVEEAHRRAIQEGRG